MGYQLIQAPSVEPILLAEAKQHCRIDISDDDALVSLLITAARQYAEQLTARSFITQQWPITLPQIGSAAVTFTAGYGANGDAVPVGLKHWMKLRIGALYENREEIVSGRSITVDPLPFVDSLLDPYRIMRA